MTQTATTSKSSAGQVAGAIGCLAMVVLTVAALGGIAYWLFRQDDADAPTRGAQRCVATADDHSVALELEQAQNASIIAGLSIKRGLPPRAASIALTTVYQESMLRNLDHGDRDSVGLFQQRPSQGWGTPEQLMDPYYATGKFYDALVKVKNWQTDDINDVAQKVQISGYPEAYRDHEQDGRALASVLTGHSDSGFSCLEREGTSGDAGDLVKAMNKTFGSKLKASKETVTATPKTTELTWAFAHFAIANSELYGVTSVRVGNQVWNTDEYDLPAWDPVPETVAPVDSERRVQITVR